MLDQTVCGPSAAELESWWSRALRRWLLQRRSPAVPRPQPPDYPDDDLNDHDGDQDDGCPRGVSGATCAVLRTAAATHSEDRQPAHVRELPSRRDTRTAALLLDQSDLPTVTQLRHGLLRAVTASPLPLTGGCNCGAVRFEVSEPLLGAVYCHCTRCQRRTGTAAAPSAAVKPGTFRLVSGEDHTRRWSGGDGNDKVFCGTCGSHLFSQNPQDPEIINVRMGSFDGDPGVRPAGRVHVASAATWESIPDDGLMRLPGPLAGFDPRSSDPSGAG